MLSLSIELTFTNAADARTIDAQSIAALRTGQPVYVVSLDRVFQWYPLATAADNGTSVIQPTAVVGAGRFVWNGVGNQASAFRARFVVTTNIANLAAFPVAAGNNDGVTAVQGDVALLPFQTAPAERGPWVVGVVAAGVAPLTRPAGWWPVGATILSGTTVGVGGEGTVYRNTRWGSMPVADSTVVDTSDPVLYPLVLRGASTLVNGTVTKASIPILAAASQVEVRRALDNTPNFTVQYVALAAGITPGIAGSFVARGELADGSLNVADQSGITWTIRNGDGG